MECNSLYERVRVQEHGMNGIQERLLLNESEAAKVLSISPRKLWQLRHDGAIPYVLIGRSVRYPVSDLQRWIDSQVTRQPAPEGA